MCRKGGGAQLQSISKGAATMEMRCEITYTRRATEMIGKSIELVKILQACEVTKVIKWFYNEGSGTKKLE